MRKVLIALKMRIINKRDIYSSGYVIIKNISLN